MNDGTRVCRAGAIALLVSMSVAFGQAGAAGGGSTPRRPPSATKGKGDKHVSGTIVKIDKETQCITVKLRVVRMSANVDESTIPTKDVCCTETTRFLKRSAAKGTVGLKDLADGESVRVLYHEEDGKAVADHVIIGLVRR